MKRIALIASAVVLLLGGIGGALFYLKPALLFGAAKSAPPAEAAAAVPQSTIPEIDAPEAQAGFRRQAASLVNRLAVIQDRVAHGDRAALSDQKMLLANIGDAIRHFEKHDWQDFANIRASLIYVLSGGDPTVLSPLIASDTAMPADKKLAEGIYHFARGQTHTASKTMDEIDPRALDVTLVGPYALARGSLHIEDNPAAAIALFDEARLASPHTAIEEAAMRREIPLLTASNDTARALAMIADYTHRFGQSIYARKLFASFGAAIAARSELDEAATLATIEHLLDPVDENPNSELLLELAGQALLRGRLLLARGAADGVLNIAPSRPAAHDKATLYRAAADAPSPAAEKALTALAAISASGLSDTDVEIKDVADYLARGIAAPEKAPAVAAAASDTSKPSSPELLRVSNALGDADAAVKHADLLSGISK